MPIVSPDGSIRRVVTQADVIRFLATHVDELGPLAGATVRACDGVVCLDGMDNKRSSRHCVHQASSSCSVLLVIAFCLPTWRKFHYTIESHRVVPAMQVGDVGLTSTDAGGTVPLTALVADVKAALPHPSVVAARAISESGSAESPSHHRSSSPPSASASGHGNPKPMNSSPLASSHSTSPSATSMTHKHDALSPRVAAGAHVAGTGTSPQRELGPSSRQLPRLVVARFTDHAIDVLLAMRNCGAAAAPVVDSYGAVAANVSLSDIKAIAKRGNFGALNLPLQAFFAELDKGVAPAMNPSIYVRSTTQIASLVLTLAATKIHQLYHVDANLHPVGCIRIVDVLRILVAGE